MQNMISQVFIFGLQIALFWFTKHFTHSTGPDSCIIITEIERRLQNISVVNGVMGLDSVIILNSLICPAFPSVQGALVFAVSFILQVLVSWVLAKHLIVRALGVKTIRQWRKRSILKTLLCLYFVFLRPILQFLDWWNRILGQKKKPRNDAMEEQASHIPVDCRLFPFNFTVDTFMTYISERSQTRRPSLNEKHGCSSTCSSQSTDQEVARSPYHSSPSLEKAETEWSVKQDRVFLKTSRSFNSPILKFLNPEMEMERQISALHLQRLRKRMTQCVLKRKPVRARSS